MLLDMLLKTDVPDEIKIDFKILKAHTELTDAARKIVETATMSIDTPYEEKKKTLEYLALVTSGMKQFMNSEQLENE